MYISVINRKNKGTFVNVATETQSFGKLTKRTVTTNETSYM